MNCPKCSSEKTCKAGKTNGRQRYRCNICIFYYSVVKKSDVKTQEQRQLALDMYLEVLDFRAIGRILKISYATVFYWVKSYGNQAKLPKNAVPIEVAEVDEMRTYIGEKKSTVGYGF